MRPRAGQGLRRWRLLPSLVVTAAAASVLLSAQGCGGDDGDGNGAAQAAATSGGGGELYVASAEKGSLVAAGGGQSFELTLEDVTGNVVVFTDRPQRKVSSESPAEFVDAWTERGFDDDPPNAALEVSRESGEPLTKVFELSQPRFDASTERLSFHARDLGDQSSSALSGFAAGADSDLPTRFGESGLFIDNGYGATDLWNVYAGPAGGTATITFNSGTIDPVSTFLTAKGHGTAHVLSSNQVKITCFDPQCIGLYTFKLDPDQVPITGTLELSGGATMNRYVGDSTDQQVVNIPAGSFSITPDQ